MDPCRRISIALLLGILPSCASLLPESEPAPASSNAYVFAWPFRDPSLLVPRGGTTRGTDVQLASTGGEAWRELQDPRLAPRARDRAAILAMAGDYRASFDFLETLVYEPGGEPARPYRSWGTERVYVLEDRDDFVSLQHIMVMFVVDDAGVKQGPFVQKHWRQDWRYEPADLLEYRGFRRWRLRALASEERRGRWSQTVYQVDDSPRFASLGSWQHDRQASTWEGDEAWRPLPRREHTVRSDYQVLAGSHRVTLLPRGWVHEQDNLKLVVDEASGRTLARRAREVGVNRYDRIEGFAFTSGDEYWRATGAFWQAVREGWTRRIGGARGIEVARRCSGEPGYVPFFRFANRLVEGETLSAEAQRAEAERILECLVTNG